MTPLDRLIQNLFVGTRTDGWFDIRGKYTEHYDAQQAGGYVHQWERIPNSDQAERCVKCEKVSTK